MPSFTVQAATLEEGGININGKTFNKFKVSVTDNDTTQIFNDIELWAFADAPPPMEGAMETGTVEPGKKGLKLKRSADPQVVGGSQPQIKGRPTDQPVTAPQSTPNDYEPNRQRRIVRQHSQHIAALILGPAPEGDTTAYWERFVTLTNKLDVDVLGDSGVRF